MHRENNERMGLLSYIKGNKKGREAHNLEREAMRDPFLADALDGYGNIDDPELDARLCRMEEKVEQCLWDFEVAAPVLAQYDMSYRVEYGMKENEMHDDVSRRSKPSLPKRHRRNYFIWISAAACLLIVCTTISYKIGVLRGEKKFEMDVQHGINETLVYERAVLDSAEAMMGTHYSPNGESRIASAELNADSKKLPHENANELPCPANGYKKYYEFIYKEMKELVTFDPNNISGIVVLNFDIDNSGRPSNIEITESSSETIARKLVDIIREGDSWSGHGKVESFVFLY